MGHNPSPYAGLMLAGIVVSALLWSRRGPRDPRLPAIYVGALAGALFGAKLAYLLAEGWQDVGRPDMWLRLATGKSILGALLGGYGGVELAKRWVGYRSTTGDLFASVAPVGIILGRIGCWLHGCCGGLPCPASWYSLRDVQGVDRWPAVPVEIGFNVVMLAVAAMLRRQGIWAGQHFHVYLVSYGTFRFVHEFFRDTPRILGSFSGYHGFAAATVVFGLWAFRRRATAAVP